MTLDETYDFLMQIRRKEIIIRRKETQRDELRACLLPGAIRYDRDRVQSTPTDNRQSGRAGPRDRAAPA